MKLSGQSQAELIKATLVLVAAGVIVYYGKKFVDSVTSKIPDIATIPEKIVVAAGDALGTAGAAVVETAKSGIEKANDKLKSKISTREVISVTDDDLFPDSNIASRENINEVIRTVTESIRTQSSGILRGVRAIDEKIVDRQTVAVTVRWDKDSEKAVQELRRRIR